MGFTIKSIACNSIARISQSTQQHVGGYPNVLQIGDSVHRSQVSLMRYRLLRKSHSSRRSDQHLFCSCNSAPTESSHSFHQSRLKKSNATFPKAPVQLQIRCVSFLLFDPHIFTSMIIGGIVVVNLGLQPTRVAFHAV